MLQNFIYSDWINPPEEMDFQIGYDDLLSDIKTSLDYCISREDRVKKSFLDYGKNLYLRTHVIVNNVLDYKICIEFGLPLHPKIYSDLSKEKKNPAKYSQEMKEEAHDIFLESIDLARKIYQLHPQSVNQLGDFNKKVPPALLNFHHVNRKDKYTWRASNPKYINELAETISKEIEPDLVIGSAHGAIRPGILLANLLDCDLYFLRNSRFKRNDRSVVYSENDLDYLKQFQEKTVILLDEDVAKGTTLRNFVGEVGPMFRHCYSSSIIRHYLSSFWPDFVGWIFFD